jgi:hypothetical protein
MPNGALIHENMSVLPDHLREQVTDRAVLKTLKQSCTFDNRRQGSVPGPADSQYRDRLGRGYTSLPICRPRARVLGQTSSNSLLIT